MRVPPLKVSSQNTRPAGARGGRNAPILKLTFGLPAERLIALARLTFAGFATVAIYVDSTQPAGNSGATYAILAGYLAYAAILVLCPARALANRPFQFVSHLVDIAVFSALVQLTDGPTSPFFVAFTFALLSATLRWNWQAPLALQRY